MGWGKLVRRWAPALFLGTGSVLAGEPFEPAQVIAPPTPGTPAGVAAPFEYRSPPLAMPPFNPSSQLVPQEVTLLPDTSLSTITESVPLSGIEGIFTEVVDTGPGLSWVRAEFLSWTLTGARVPSLVTSLPPNDGNAFYVTPGATIFGGDKQLDGHRPGARITIGSWFNSDRDFGWEASGFWLDRQDDGIRAGSDDGSRSIASSPFTDALTGQQTALIISAPGLAYGSTQVSHASRAIWGAEILGRALLTSGEGWRMDGLFGYRCIQFNEQLDIHKSIFLLNPFVIPGTEILCDDGITAQNKFHGGVLGFDFQSDWHGCLLSVRPSVAIGQVENTVNRTGVMGARVPGFPDFFHLGGTYNLSSNIGQVQTRDWTVVPEIELRLVREICTGLRASVGYTCIYLPQVVRASEQIDTVVNPNLLAPILPGGPARPAPLLERNSALLQGLSVGLELRF